MSNPVVSIIIVSFNNYSLLRDCLKSLNKYKGGVIFEVIIIDNNSDEGTRNYVKSLNRDRYKIIYNKVNLGFAKANNQGLRLATGRYFVLLNNDTIVTNNWLKELLYVVESEEKIGIVGSLLLFPDGNFIQHAGVRIAQNAQKLLPYHIHMLEYCQDVFDDVKTEQFQVVTGACMLIKREVVDQVGLLDEGFFNGYEDVDFCFRAKLKGYKVYLAHKSTVFHYESMSKGRNDFAQDNQVLLDKKWRGIIKPDRSLTSFVCAQIILRSQYIKQFIQNKKSPLKPKMIISFGKGYVDQLENLAKFYRRI